ncbi:hypothetical protein E2562_007583 [Oryza meyeriana var. granulata]|uniref:Ninja-family protein n=1 Tax=Oryza meyeriana var. granulata TaxID=110450 RepID=A0A6G1DWL1_9ORYZ|nr:hypothetical protein E2562_007583 [Oryza meyeriana var. granulata]
MASSDSSSSDVEVPPRPLRMHAPSDDDELPEMQYPQPRCRHAGRGRSRPVVAEPLVVQEPEQDPPPPQQPAPPAPAPQQQNLVYFLCCPPDVVTATGNGPDGRTAVGFLCRTIAPPAAAGDAGINATMIMCTCHGTSFTPADFLLHAGSTDVSHPERKIKAYPWLGGEAAPPPANGGGQ